MPDPLFLQIMSSNVFPRSIKGIADGSSNIKPIRGWTIWVSKIAEFDADFESVKQVANLSGDKKFGALLYKLKFNFPSLFRFLQIFP
jgi:hypothetical protein